MRSEAELVATDNARKGQLALVALVVGAACLGFSGILARISEVGPAATGFWRMALMLPLFWLWAYWGKRQPAHDPESIGRRDVSILLLAGLLFGADIAFWHWSVGLTTIANATLMANLTPVIVALASVFLFGEQLQKPFYLGLALSLVGAAALSGASLDIGGGRPLGDLLAFMAAIFYGGYLVVIGRLRGRFGTATVMAWSGLSASLLLLPIAWAFGETVLPDTARGWGLLFGLALSAQLVGQTLIAWAFAHLAASFGALALLVQPIVAAGAAWLLLGERLGVTEFLGATMILAGIAIARLSTARKIGPDIKAKP